MKTLQFGVLDLPELLHLIFAIIAPELRPLSKDQSLEFTKYRLVSRTWKSAADEFLFRAFSFQFSLSGDAPSFHLPSRASKLHDEEGPSVSPSHVSQLKCMNIVLKKEYSQYIRYLEARVDVDTPLQHCTIIEKQVISKAFDNYVDLLRIIISYSHRCLNLSLTEALRFRIFQSHDFVHPKFPASLRSLKVTTSGNNLGEIRGRSFIEDIFALTDLRDLSLEFQYADVIPKLLPAWRVPTVQCTQLHTLRIGGNVSFDHIGIDLSNRSLLLNTPHLVTLDLDLPRLRLGSDTLRSAPSRNLNTVRLQWISICDELAKYVPEHSLDTHPHSWPAIFGWLARNPSLKSAHIGIDSSRTPPFAFDNIRRVADSCPDLELISLRYNWGLNTFKECSNIKAEYKSLMSETEIGILGNTIEFKSSDTMEIHFPTFRKNLSFGSG